MSVRVMALVFEAPLPPEEKLLMLALADWASDDGGNIYPTLDMMRQKTSGRSDRAVQYQLRHLERKGLLVLVKPAHHHQPRHYRINLDVLKAIVAVAGVQPVAVQPTSPLNTSGVQPIARGVQPIVVRGATHRQETVLFPNGDAEMRVPSVSKPSVRNNRQSVAHPIKTILTAFCEQFRTKFQDQYAVKGGKDASLAKRLLAVYGLDGVLRRIPAFFNSRDPFICGSGYSFGVFESCFTKLIVQEHSEERRHQALAGGTGKFDVRA